MGGSQGLGEEGAWAVGGGGCGDGAGDVGSLVWGEVGGSGGWSWGGEGGGVGEEFDISMEALVRSLV